MLKNSFKKQERLTGKKNFEKLLAEGQGVHLFPFTVFWMHLSDQKAPVRIAISIPKRKLKHATERNLVRRRVRESYRTNKHKLISLLEDRNQQLHILIVYVPNEILEFNIINQKIIEVLNHLMKIISKN